MARRQSNNNSSPTAIVPVGRNFEAKFSELDNWLGIMDIDPPQTDLDKRAMYFRLIDILDNLFDNGSASKNRKANSRDSRVGGLHPDKFQIQQQMRKIIGP